MATSRQSRKRTIGEVKITAEETKGAVKIKVEPQFIWIPVLTAPKRERKTTRPRKPRTGK